MRKYLRSVRSECQVQLIRELPKDQYLQSFLLFLDQPLYHSKDILAKKCTFLTSNGYNIFYDNIWPT